MPAGADYFFVVSQNVFLTVAFPDAHGLVRPSPAHGFSFLSRSDERQQPTSTEEFLQLE